jgi:hypothetical protein
VSRIDLRLPATVGNRRLQRGQIGLPSMSTVQSFPPPGHGFSGVVMAGCRSRVSGHEVSRVKYATTGRHQTPGTRRLRTRDAYSV